MNTREGKALISVTVLCTSSRTSRSIHQIPEIIELKRLLKDLGMKFNIADSMPAWGIQCQEWVEFECKYELPSNQSAVWIQPLKLDSYIFRNAEKGRFVVMIHIEEMVDGRPAWVPFTYPSIEDYLTKRVNPSLIVKEEKKIEEVTNNNQVGSSQGI